MQKSSKHPTKKLLTFRHLSKPWRIICKCALILIVSIISGFGLLLLVAQIPKAAIHQNTLESAKYFLSFESAKPNLIEPMHNTKRDFYADSIWLSIAYGYDGNPKSVISSKYAHSEDTGAREDLLAQLQDKLDANTDYSRYWHGPIVFIRPLLVFLNIKQIYILNTIIISALFLTIVVILIKHKEYAGTGIFVATMISILFFFAGTSLEYAQAIVIMEITTIAALKLAWQKKKRKLPYLFFFTGITVNFFDFLTTETLTLTIPLLLVLWLRRNRKMSLTRFEKILHLALFWLAGYVLMWLAKWVIAYLVLGKDTLYSLGDQMGQRSFMSEAGLSIPEILIASLKLNLGSLFPFCLNKTLAIICIVALAIIAIKNISSIRQKLNPIWLLSVATIGAIPLLRNLILVEHGWRHFFFTYRAFGALVMAVLMILIAAITNKSKSDQKS